MYFISRSDPALRMTHRATARRASVVLPPRTALRFARLGRTRALGVEAAFFIAADPPVRPEPFEDEFRRGGGQRAVRVAVHPEASDVLHQSLNAVELAEGFLRRSHLGKFQLAAHLEPLHHRLEV